MQKLSKKEALDIIKYNLDKAVKEGIFSSLNEVYTIVAAFDVIAKKTIDESPNDELGQ
jgi:hypothetical protein